jgi:hypothetical protein
MNSFESMSILAFRLQLAVRSAAAEITPVMLPIKNDGSPLKHDFVVSAIGQKQLGSSLRPLRQNAALVAVVEQKPPPSFLDCGQRTARAQKSNRLEAF